MTNIKQIVDSFPLSDVSLEKKPQKPDTPTLPWLGLGSFYTKQEVDRLIKAAVDEARAIDEESMRKHNRDATIISMILGFTTLALFVDGMLRMLGIIPPFMHLDVNILEDIAEKTKIIVENDLVKAGLNKIPRL